MAIQKIKYIFLFVLVTLISFELTAQIQEDQAFFNLLKNKFEQNEDIKSNDLLIAIGKEFINVPYVANTLDKNDNEKLVINLTELDCTTFVENCIALSYTLKNCENPSIDDFCTILKEIRYKEGNIDGYASRNHYMTSWISNNQKYLTDITLDLGGEKVEKQINFMSSHVSSYPMLVKDTSQIKYIRSTENEISNSDMYAYIPKNKIEGMLSQLCNGDIVVFATRINSLDYSHIGLILKDNDDVKLLHASSYYKKVIIDPKPLNKYCQDNKSCIGITILRLK